MANMSQETWEKLGNASVPDFNFSSSALELADAEFFKANRLRPSAWISIFHALGSSASIPDAPLKSMEWYRLAISNGVAPMVILTTGMIGSAFMVVYLQRWRLLRRKEKASPLSTICLTVVSCILILGGVLLALNASRAGFATSLNEIESCLQDLKDTRLSVSSISYVADSSRHSMEKLGQCCPQVWPVKGMCEEQVSRLLAKFQVGYTALSKAAAHTDDLLASTIKNFEAVHESRKAPGITVLALFTPAILSLAMLIFIVGAALAVNESFDRPYEYKLKGVCNWLFKFGGVPLAGVMVVVSTYAALGMGVGIAGAQFCQDPDANVIKLFVDSNETETKAYAAAKYYIEGEGKNPFLVAMSKEIALLHGFEAYTQNWFYTTIMSILEAGCPPVHNADFAGLIQQIRWEVSKAQYRTSRPHVYKYYHDSVHRSICGSVMSTTGWLTLTYLLAGIVCIPTLTIQAHDMLMSYSNAAADAADAQPEHSPTERPEQELYDRLSPGA
eukprot:TRINITY_DN21798_c0_g1_i1.p1 TRINITY_DN21798_c0_g1~~TRINITY_DN21798_c0_g1_i1.p1  ORF type:complete len:502 (-),score=55.52 TRINITY_DN21798_c0_g1_i1:243-1748(-)